MNLTPYPIIEEKEIQLENKIKSQVSHVINLYEGRELQNKIGDLVFEWYMRGFATGMTQLTPQSPEAHEHD